jgi:hypothetical protein
MVSVVSMVSMVSVVSNYESGRKSEFGKVIGLRGHWEGH